MTQTQVWSVREKSKENKACAQMLNLNFNLYQCALCCRQLVGLTLEITFRFCFVVFTWFFILLVQWITHYLLPDFIFLTPSQHHILKNIHFCDIFSAWAELSGSLTFFGVRKGTSSTAGGTTHVNLDRWNLFSSFSSLFFNSSSLHLPLFSWSISYACGKVCGCWQKDKSARSFPFRRVFNKGHLKERREPYGNCIWM